MIKNDKQTKTFDKMETHLSHLMGGRLWNHLLLSSILHSASAYSFSASWRSYSTRSAQLGSDRGDLETHGRSLSAITSCQLHINLARITVLRAETELRPSVTTGPAQCQPAPGCLLRATLRQSVRTPCRRADFGAVYVYDASVILVIRVGPSSYLATAAACKFVWMYLYGVLGVKEGCNPTPSLLQVGLRLSVSHTHAHTHTHTLGQLPYLGPLPVHQRKRLQLKEPFSSLFFLLLHLSRFFQLVAKCESSEVNKHRTSPPPPSSQCLKSVTI